MFVVGGKVVASMQRTGARRRVPLEPASRRRAEAIKISPEERAASVKAARSMGLNVCGVDLLQGQPRPGGDGSQFLAGLEGIEHRRRSMLPGMIIEFLEKNARPGHTRNKGKG